MANTYCKWQMLIKYLTYDNSFFDGCVFENEIRITSPCFPCRFAFSTSYCQMVLVHGQTAATDSRRATPGRNPTSAQKCFLHNYPCVRGIHPWRREWRCSWSSADRRCSNYIWVLDTSGFYTLRANNAYHWWFCCWHEPANEIQCAWDCL